MMNSKQCFVCGRTQILSEFYRHPEMADGHLNKCKECCKRQAIENRQKRHDYYVAYDRVRNKSEGRRDRDRQRWNTDKRKVRMKIWSARRRKDPGRKRVFRFQNISIDQKRWASDILCRAVRCGKVTRQPCVFCGAKEAEGHHEDYGRPFDVVWVCHSCHIHHFHTEPDEL